MMSENRVFNFSAGPAGLPESVLRRARDELLNWRGEGASVMELSHRGKAFIAVAEKAEADIRELLGIPERYKVLFLQGGATAQFAAVPLNLLGSNACADYVNTGVWSKKAIAEARRHANVNVVASDEANGFTAIPPESEWQTDPNSAYLHFTPNETIGGVEFHWLPECSGVPLVADMSSTLLSRPLDVSRFGLIYAGAQKNIGPAGLTMVIVREDLLGHANTALPSVCDYAVQAKAGSMSNTPPTFAWYLAGLVFEWLLDQGGLEAMAAINRRKSDKLYAAIDGSAFYSNPVRVDCRSWMNVPFTLADSGLDGTFLSQAADARLTALKGHRSVGGMRASIYNAMPESGVDTLIEFMTEFERRRG